MYHWEDKFCRFISPLRLQLLTPASHRKNAEDLKAFLSDKMSFTILQFLQKTLQGNYEIKQTCNQLTSKPLILPEH
jgi:uncharacterized protein (DUF2336 family)